MGTEFAPMLADDMTDVTQVTWPKLASPKFDGYRCVVKDKVAWSRNLKPIPNELIQVVLGKKALEGLDGELIVGAATGEGVLGRTSSGVRKKAGNPDFTFYVFDDSSALGRPFHYRHGRAEDRIEDFNHPRVKLVEHTLVHSAAGLRAYEADALRQGYEGVILRDPEGPYKYGRATELQGYLLKVKRFTDGEALITGVEQGQHNTNEAIKDALGHLKRSTSKAGMVPSGLVGTILAKDLKTGEPLRIAPGRMTAAQRQHFWQFPKELVGQVSKYKCFEYGAKDMDRFPTHQLLLHPDDVPHSKPARTAAAL